MMRFKLSLISGLIFSCFLLNSQGLGQKSTPLDFAEHLYESQNYRECITEYWRFLFFNPEHPMAFYAFYKAGLAYKHLQDWDAAIPMLRKALHQAPSQKQGQFIRYQLAICYLARGEIDIAQLELFKIYNTPDSSLTIKRAAILIHAITLLFKNDGAGCHKVLQRFGSASDVAPDQIERLNQINDQLDQFVRLRRKSPALAKWLATFIPGSGQIYAGHYGNGINALVLNSATSYWVAKEAQEGDFRDVLLVLTSIWIRYYIGNRLHAEEMAIRTNQENEQKILTRIYDLMAQLSSKFSQQTLIMDRSQIGNLQE